MAFIFFNKQTGTETTLTYLFLSLFCAKSVLWLAHDVSGAGGVGAARGRVALLEERNHQGVGALVGQQGQ